MTKHVGTVALEIVLEDEDVNELRVRALHQHEPRQRYGEVKQNAGNPQRLQNQLPLTAHDGKDHDDESGEGRNG